MKPCRQKLVIFLFTDTMPRGRDGVDYTSQEVRQVASDTETRQFFYGGKWIKKKKPS